MKEVCIFSRYNAHQYHYMIQEIRKNFTSHFIARDLHSLKRHRMKNSHTTMSEIVTSELNHVKDETSWYNHGL